MTTLEQVKEFHEKFGHPVADNPNIGDAALNKFRMDLFDEETLTELRAALAAGDKNGVLDALCDTQVVLDGAFLALGFYRVKEAACSEVHRSNMSKLGADGNPVLREDGKILKGPNYSPPNLQTFIDWLECLDAPPPHECITREDSTVCEICGR